MNAAESIQWAAMTMPGMGSEMTGPMPLPGWVRIVGSSLFLLVVVVHIRHATGKQVWTRVWHGAHVLMALGMIAVLLPGPAGAVSRSEPAFSVLRRFSRWAGPLPRRAGCCGP